MLTKFPAPGKTLLALSFAVSLLAGCTMPAHSPSAPQTAQVENAPTTAQTRARLAYEERVAVVSRRTRALCVSPVYKAYFKHTPCLALDITDKDLRNPNRPTKGELAAAAEAFKTTDALNKETFALLKDSPVELQRQKAALAERFYPRIDALQKEFLEGRMTWGTYNAKRKALNDELTEQNDRLTNAKRGTGKPVGNLQVEDENAQAAQTNADDPAEESTDADASHSEPEHAM